MLAYNSLCVVLESFCINHSLFPIELFASYKTTPLCKSQGMSVSAKFSFGWVITGARQKSLINVSFRGEHHRKSKMYGRIVFCGLELRKEISKTRSLWQFCTYSFLQLRTTFLIRWWNLYILHNVLDLIEIN